MYYILNQFVYIGIFLLKLALTIESDQSEASKRKNSDNGIDDSNHEDYLDKYLYLINGRVSTCYMSGIKHLTFQVKL